MVLARSRKALKETPIALKLKQYASADTALTNLPILQLCSLPERGESRLSNLPPMFADEFVALQAYPANHSHDAMSASRTSRQQEPNIKQHS